MKQIILIGSGGHAKTCIDVIEQEKKFKINLLIEKKIKLKKLFNYKIVSEDEFLNTKHKIKYAFIAIGQIKKFSIRELQFNKFKKLGFTFPILKSPNAYVSKNASIKAGTLIAHGCIINSGASIGLNCIINNRALLDHDVIVENNCHISTGALLNGSVTIKSGSFIGSGTVIRENITIGKNSIIGAGLIIKKNIKPFSLVK